MKNWIKPETVQIFRALLLNKKLSGTLLIGYAVTGVLIALLVPADFLSSNAWARGFVDAMGEVIPAIEKVGHFSKLSEVAQFHLAVMWALAPMVILALTPGVWMKKLSEWEKPLEYASTHRIRTLLLLAAPPMFTFALYWLSPGESPGRQLSAYLGSRSGLAIWTLVGPMAAFAFFSLWLGMFKVIKPLLRTVFLRSSGSTQLNMPSTTNKGE